MKSELYRTICWAPSWNETHEGIGLEHLQVSANVADSVALGVDPEKGLFRLHYQLRWNTDWQLHSADLIVSIAGTASSLSLRTDGHGRWQDDEGRPLSDLDGCMDIDIWPTPFTNSFPIRRCAMRISERREFRMAWVHALQLTVKPQLQAYTRLAERLYLFESLDGSGFKAELPVDEDGFVLDYPGLFRRVQL